ncbi:2OG-Fe(II) oxygenase [Erythrobacter sp. SDW2]|uniref:2OG-Fe(II) oxygenase n=1 Tax=Erythrobacter sp. SDW2 TaxID=2907154 RepID=UPI001F1DC5A2|nr:2OG-Fe(II) oxygenase [Erythrobacter sp. SDW2]UIP07975.1 2OG-Fe(II) oxygenase [Erythrobacter sp. SDW2]
MNGHAVARHAIVDGFLAGDVAEALLDHALQNEALFQPALVRAGGGYRVSEEDRQAFSMSDLGPAGPHFTAAIEAHFEHLCREVGLAPFPIAAWDVEMAAHRDGGFFHEHIDTMTAENRPGQPGDRIISLVYYLHRPGAGFTGGELVLRPFFGNDSEARVAPIHNRLVAFPSFARHEVEPTHVPDNAWEDARFSINCWLLRAR